jgi:hypothetical protein
MHHLHVIPELTFSKDIHVTEPTRCTICFQFVTFNSLYMFQALFCWSSGGNVYTAIGIFCMYYVRSQQPADIIHTKYTILLYIYYIMIYLLFSLAVQPSAGYGLLVPWGFLITHNDVPQSVGFLLDEWSAHHRDYLTTHNRWTSIPPVGFEPMIAAGKRL